MTHDAGAASFQAHLFCIGIHAVLALDLNDKNVTLMLWKHKPNLPLISRARATFTFSLVFLDIDIFYGRSIKSKYCGTGSTFFWTSLFKFLCGFSLRIPKWSCTKFVETSESVNASLYPCKESANLIWIFLSFTVYVHHNICLALQIRHREHICVLILLAILFLTYLSTRLIIIIKKSPFFTA